MEEMFVIISTFFIAVVIIAAVLLLGITLKLKRAAIISIFIGLAVSVLSFCAFIGRQSIRVFQRPENSGSQTMLEKIMGNIPIMEPRREDISEGMGRIINQVAVYKNFSNSIGYSFLFYSTEMVKNDRIKLLSIDGIYPSRETIQDGSYPFSNSFYAIYVDTADKNENIEAFIEWILSDQGQYLIEKTGYTPIKANL